MDQIKRAIYYAVFVGATIAYVYLYWTFLQDIRDAHGVRADLDNGAVQIATGIGGLFAGVFAVAFGIQRKDPTVDEKKLRVGDTLTPNATIVAGTCLVVYFLVGAVSLIVTASKTIE